MDNNSVIPMSSPDLTDAEVAAVSEVLRTRHLSMGPQLEAFERAVASYLGADHAVGVSSGTSGLHLAMIAAGVGAGSLVNRHSAPDLVITSSFSFVASANCILYERAIPVFVDVDPCTGNIHPEQVVEAAHDLSAGGHAARRWLPPALRDSGVDLGRLKAILPIHAFGQSADMDPILEAGARYGLAVIEDACESLGAGYKGDAVGTLGKAAVFAFYPNKQMTTGEGGMIVTDDAAWADLFRSLRNQGRDLTDRWLNHSRLGFNYRLDELSAALGLVQMGRLEEMLAKRKRVAGWYDERLAGVELVERPCVATTTTRMSWFVYVVRIKPPASRDAIMQALAEEGIPCRPYFSPIHLQPFYREYFGYRRGDLPTTELLGERSLALPFSGVMSESQVDRVCERLRAVLMDAAE